jgi:hypothetical protein
VDAQRIPPLVLKELGMRIEPSMAQYIARRLAGASAPIPVIGGDARTGVPVRKWLEPDRLQAAHPAEQQ